MRSGAPRCRGERDASCRRSQLRRVRRTGTAGGWAVGEWPSVSAVVATRERPILLRRAVRSILFQRYEGRLECVVVFDRSEPEDLGDLVPDDDRRSLVVIRNDRTPGLAGARNSGAEAATGDLLA